MTRQTKDNVDLEALADMVLHCRESARALRLNMLTYYLDMAFVAARSDLDRPRDKVDVAALRAMFCLPAPEAGEPWLLDLMAIRTAVAGCRNWARDLDRSLLVYVLEMTMLEASSAANGRR